MVTAFTLAWSRSLGEFGPIYVFAGTTRMKTEVLSSTVFLELNANQLHSAVAVSLLMVGIAVVVLLIVRSSGLRALARSRALQAGEGVAGAPECLLAATSKAL